MVQGNTILCRIKYYSSLDKRRYQWMISLPQSNVMIVASDKKVPNGMMSFLDFFLKITRKIAVNPPSNIPPKRATMMFGNPTIKPIIAAIFTSPIPMPSFLNISREKMAASARNTSPNAPPIRPNKKLCRLNTSGTKKLTINAIIATV